MSLDPPGLPRHWRRDGRRRLRDAGLPLIITRAQASRAMVVTDLLEQGVPIEDV